MNTIIRIEHPISGNGLFRAYQNDICILSSMSFDNELYKLHTGFPSPFSDELLGDINLDEYCAFKSIEQIQQWIKKEWWNEIIDKGFKVYMIDVSKCQIGEYQILYHKYNILQCKDITSLFITSELEIKL